MQMLQSHHTTTSSQLIEYISTLKIEALEENDRERLRFLCLQYQYHLQQYSERLMLLIKNGELDFLKHTQNSSTTVEKTPILLSSSKQPSDSSPKTTKNNIAEITPKDSRNESQL